MDRERKLLYLIAVLAPIFEGMTLKLYYDGQDFLARSSTAVVEVNQCHERLIRAWAECTPRPLRRHPQEF